MFRFSPFRDRRFVSRRIQGRLMARVGLYWVLYHVVLWHGLVGYRYIHFRMTGAVGQAPISFWEQFGQLAVDYSPVLLCGLLTLPVVLIDTLFVSHRIAGPLVQLGNALRELKNGRTVDRIVLRRQDLLTEFQHEFNAYLAWLEQKSVAPVGGAVNFPVPTRSDEAEIAAQIAEFRAPTPDVAGVAGGPGTAARAPGPPVCST